MVMKENRLVRNAVNKNIQRQAGFTLIELMIVVVIVSIIAAIAYPSYRSSVLKSQRTDARAALLETAQILERCYTEFNAYNNVGCSIVDAGPVINKVSNVLPLTGNGFYTVTNTALTATAYTIQAVANSNGNQDDDTRCATFTLTHTGVQTATSADCW